MKGECNPLEYIKSLKSAQQQPTGIDRALNVAYQERTREIALFWTRSGFFWTLLTVAFGGYFALVSAKGYESSEAFIVSCLGSITALAWYCANRGSKYWQENWEYQVELLEESTLGPLHRTHLGRNNYHLGKIAHAYPYSVSKIAQILSAYVLALWLTLAVGSAIQIRSWNILTFLVSALTVFAFIAIAFGAYKRFSPVADPLKLYRQGAQFPDIPETPIG